jgi:hypothetical protein
LAYQGMPSSTFAAMCLSNVVFPEPFRPMRPVEPRVSHVFPTHTHATRTGERECKSDPCIDSVHATAWRRRVETMLDTAVCLATFGHESISLNSVRWARDALWPAYQQHVPY